jgi:predicted transcriptional regulator
VKVPRLSGLEFKIMDILWDRGESSIRDICDAMEAGARGKRVPAYTTVQTTVYRMEAKKIVRRLKKVTNFHIFAAAITRSAAQRTLVDELLNFFGGKGMPVMAHLIESGKISLQDVQEAERTMQEKSKKKKA